MSNLETAPPELACANPVRARGTQMLEPRAVPLGGPRAMTVRRTLPQRARSLIGAWCFADHYGPDDVSATGGMRVAGHPHTGLQTVSWLFRGEIEHRDTTGAHALVRTGREHARGRPALRALPGAVGRHAARPRTARRAAAAPRLAARRG